MSLHSMSGSVGPIISGSIKAGAELTLEFSSLRLAYRSGALGPVQLVEELYRRMDLRGTDHVWTQRFSLETLRARAKGLEFMGADALPLYGIPFSVKDNVDVQGWPTASACSAITAPAKAHAPIIAQLESLGAILIGKNNMDQFATGLVGIRNPDGFCRNAFDADYIPGGSSSGSGVAVAAGLVSFAIGSDTGGSGRVPAACNNVVGLKPTPGLIPAMGLMPANRTFDCYPVFALTCQDAYEVFSHLNVHDARDPFALPPALRAQRPLTGLHAPVVGVLREDDREFFGDADAAEQYDRSLQRMMDMGAVLKAIDFTPFHEAGQMVFNSALVAERFASLEGQLLEAGDALDPAVRENIERCQAYSGVDVYRTLYRVAELKAEVKQLMAHVDVLALPTCATLYRVAEVEADPIGKNLNMGYYTYFANPLGLAVVAVPASFRVNGLPFGISLVGQPCSEQWLCRLGERFHSSTGLPLGAQLLNRALYASGAVPSGRGAFVQKAGSAG